MNPLLRMLRTSALTLVSLSLMALPCMMFFDYGIALARPNAVTLQGGEDNGNTIQTERPALPVEWLTTDGIGSYPSLLVEGTDHQFVFALDRIFLTKMHSATGAIEWTKKGSMLYPQSFDMLTTKPYMILSGATEVTIPAIGRFNRGLIQILSYPDAEVVRTLWMPISDSSIGARDGHHIAFSAKISDNERYIAVSNNGRDTARQTTVWDLETGEIVWSARLPDALPTCWTRDSTRLLLTGRSNNRATLTCWDIERNEIVWTRTDSDGFYGFPGQMSGDGKRLITRDHADGFARQVVCEYPSFKLLHRAASASETIIPSYDGRFYLVGPRNDGKGGVHVNLALVNVDNGTEKFIDTTRGYIFKSSQPGFFYAIGTGYVKKLRFDWATSVPPPATAEPVMQVFFPNPCGGIGHVSYTIEGLQPVTLELYTIQGSLIRQLAAGMQIGKQNVPVQCDTLAAGTYIVRLTVADKTCSRLVQIGGEGAE